MKPILFAKDETDFTTNGLGRLDCISCHVIEERNGMYELEAEIPVTSAHASEIEQLSIIGVIPYEGSNIQAFVVYKIGKPISGRFMVYARHISYRLSDIPCTPFSIASSPQACAQTLAGLKSHAAEPCPFNFSTDVTTGNSYTQKTPASIRQRLGGVEGSVIDQFGGEFKWDNFNVSLLKQRGRLANTTGITLRYGKNITDINQEEEIANTATGVLPFWIDTDGNNLVMIPAPDTVIYSQYAANYPYHLTQTLDLSSQFQEKPTGAQLKAVAQTYVGKSDFGIPKVSIKVSFVDLWKSEEYKDIAPLEQVQLCDEITVDFEKLGITALAKVVKTDYDVLKERYISIEVGSIRTTLAQAVTDRETSIDTAFIEQLTRVNTAIADATAWLTNANGYVVAVKNQDGTWKELLFMNTNDPSTATNAVRINENGIGFFSKAQSPSGDALSGPYSTAWTIDGRLGDFANRNYWNFITGDFSLSAGTTVGGQTIQEIADEASEPAWRAAVEAKNYAKLTQNGCKIVNGSITEGTGIWELIPAYTRDSYYGKKNVYLSFLIKRTGVRNTSPNVYFGLRFKVTGTKNGSTIVYNIGFVLKDTVSADDSDFVLKYAGFNLITQIGTAMDEITKIDDIHVSDYTGTQGTMEIKEVMISLYSAYTWVPNPDDELSIIEGFQEQLDGKIETYYQTNDPSTSWASADYSKHTGDLWFNPTTKLNKRWSGTAWVDEKAEVPDSVYDKIDGKAQIFVGSSTPTPPYFVGDLWFQDTSTDILTCINAKASGSSYSSSDWAKRNKYVDSSDISTAVSNYDTNLNQLAVYNKLTNNSQNEGVFLQNGHLYLNASMIHAGVISIGGQAYTDNPTLEIRDSVSPYNVIGLWTKDGIVATKGQFGDLIIDSSDSTLYLQGTPLIATAYLSVDTSDDTDIVYIFINPSIFAEDLQIKVVANVSATATSGRIGSMSLYKISESGARTSVETGVAVNFNSVTPVSNVFNTALDHTYEGTYQILINANRDWLNQDFSASIEIGSVSEIKTLRLGGDAIYAPTIKGNFWGSANLDGFTCKGWFIDIIRSGSIISDPAIQFKKSDDKYLQMRYNSLRLADYVSSHARVISIAPNSITRTDNSTSYTVSWVSSSDERVKEDIEDIASELSTKIIDATVPKRFKYKEADGHHYGMIAQEARKILDDLGEYDVQLEHEMPIPEDMVKIENQRMIEYTEYIPHIINYIKRQQAEIDELKEIVKKLSV